MRSVLLSVRPTYCEKIASGKKTIEVRKSRPRQETPFKVYIYMTKGFASYPVTIGGYPYICNYSGGQGVIGEFICDRIETFCVPYPAYFQNVSIGTQALIKNACLTMQEIHNYNGTHRCYAWHITDLKIYDKPKRLSEFYAKCNIPESKCKLCDNCYDRADYYGRHYAVKKIERPPQSWCYVED